MNKRIEELAQDCLEHFEPNCDSETTQFNYQKFAELIVQECIKKIETYEIPVGNSYSGELACEWTYDALKTIRRDIKEHFGVE